MKLNLNYSEISYLNLSLRGVPANLFLLENISKPKISNFNIIIFINMYISIIKQDIRIYIHYSRPNGWTEWADIFTFLREFGGNID